MGSPVPEREVEPGRSQDGFRVATFFALTFVLSWTCWIPIIGSPAHAPSTARGLVWLAGVFAPAIASLLLTAFFEGRRAMQTLLARIVRWRAAPRYYLVAIGFMLAVKVATALVIRLSTGVWPGFGSERPIIILAAIALSTPLQVGEELGWRGYALPRMASHLGLRSASLLLGLFWACWHLPQFFLQGADTYRQSFPFFRWRSSPFPLLWHGCTRRRMEAFWW